MKHLLQEFSSGKISFVEGPSYNPPKGKVAIVSALSLISPGTERMLVDFGRASLLNKALQQPDRVKEVLNKIYSDGPLATLEAVRSKLKDPIPLGYSNVGTVTKLGEGVEGFELGDRVFSNGPHAEEVCSPINLCIKIPDSVSNETASFTSLASIGLQGVRLAQPTIGESIAVLGVGLIGLLTVQILKAHGCRVLALDVNQDRLNLAKEFGAEICNTKTDNDSLNIAHSFTKGRGLDAVLITANTDDDSLVSLAAKMSRKRGRIVLVGVTGLNLERSDFYEKELTFQVSCSYGAGRYDPEYEEKGIDYPLGYVRWTEKRNFEAILDLMESGHIRTDSLITNKFSFLQAIEAYDLLTTNNDSLGIILQYDESSKTEIQSKQPLKKSFEHKEGNPVIGFIGAGDYAAKILMPNFRKAGVNLHTIASMGSSKGVISGQSNGFENFTTDVKDIFSDSEINTVVIATRHDSHADLVIDSLKANKNVFVEKPLCLSSEELEEISKIYIKSEGGLMVGFNRRFSSHTKNIKKFLVDKSEPKSYVYSINSGEIPSSHWVQDKEIGGGRIVGEVCHFIDYLRHLSDSEISNYHLSKMLSNDQDTINVSLEFDNGDLGVINYFSNGHNAFPKERLEIFNQGKILLLDNFKSLKGIGISNLTKGNSWTQDKGHKNMIIELVNSYRENKLELIPFEEIYEVSRISIELAKMAQSR